MTTTSSKIRVASIALIAGLTLGGCATSPYGDSGYSRPAPDRNGYPSQVRCTSCGVVQEVQQVYVERKSNGTLGAVIGAVAGGVLGNQIGKGDGRTAATVVGAVAGGVVGNKVATRDGNSDVAWRITVRLDGGQYVTVTQPEDPRIRQGDYVEVRGNRVYPR